MHTFSCLPNRHIPYFLDYIAVYDRNTVVLCYEFDAHIFYVIMHQRNADRRAWKLDDDNNHRIGKYLEMD
jgi:hypothetical protein